MDPPSTDAHTQTRSDARVNLMRWSIAALCTVLVACTDSPAGTSPATGDRSGSTGAAADATIGDASDGVGGDTTDLPPDAADAQTADAPDSPDTPDSRGQNDASGLPSDDVSAADTESEDASPRADARGDAETTDTGTAPPCPTGLTDDERSRLPSDGEPSRWTSAGCTNELHVLVAAAGSTWAVRVEGLEAADTVRALTPQRLPPVRAAGVVELSSAGAGDDGTAVLEVTPLFSGEVAIEIPLMDSHAYTIAASCVAGCELEATRYPMAFFHGYAGTDSYFGVLDYFFGIDGLLTDAGYEVQMPTSSPIAESETRADQLAEQLQAWMDETGARRMNIIAHSQGGLDARLLVSGKGWSDRVASITTIATPHRGIPLIAAEFLSVQDFSPDYMDVFNVAYPDVPGVRYWSWSSRSCGILEPWCIADKDGEVVDVLLGASYTLLLRFGPNDGIVPTASMIWGEHLGELSADHFDEVGQIADLSLPGDPFRHRDFYRSEARRLSAAGL